MYLPSSSLLLLPHIPDIIIAVQGMIICLLWKLADCLSPVPEELLLKGVPSTVLKCVEEQIERHDAGEDARREWGREKYYLYAIISISAVFSTTLDFISL